MVGPARCQTRHALLPYRQAYLKSQKALCWQRNTQEMFHFSLPGPEKGLGHIPVQVKHGKIPGGVPHLKLSCAQLALLLEGAWSSHRAILKFILH